jgi:hypothetical protein
VITDFERQSSLGRPNRNDDGEPELLTEALDMSPVETAYTRCEPDATHAYSRTLAVRRTPSGQWQVIEWELQSIWSGMTLLRTTPDRQDAEAYTADALNIPRAALWWPAVGGLRIQYTEDTYSEALAVD